MNFVLFFLRYSIGFMLGFIGAKIAIRIITNRKIKLAESAFTKMLCRDSIICPICELKTNKILWGNKVIKENKLKADCLNIQCEKCGCMIIIFIDPNTFTI